MSVLTTSRIAAAEHVGFRRFTIAEYHHLTEIGVLTEDDNLELLEGYLLLKMSRNPPHDGVLNELLLQLVAMISSRWSVRSQSAVSTSDSEPEPDLAVVRKDPQRYYLRHPQPSDFGIIIEVADSTLSTDRLDKGRVYARAGIPTYLIVNIPEQQVEMYTLPLNTIDPPAYTRRRDYRSGDVLPIVLDGVEIGGIVVQELFAGF